MDALLSWEQVPNTFLGVVTQRLGHSAEVKCECGSHHMVTACRWSVLEIFGCVLGALEDGNGASPRLPLNMQNRQRKAAIWQPTEHTVRLKASTLLSYTGSVDDRLNPPKVQFSFKNNIMQ